ncbi:hypothetical protein LJC19_06120 [Oxalobacter sp. OttesenSCG-928-P03]|nr:hypothetical protein [Oxalobacter sp. OttesenSCG-928-P03]
MKNNMSLAQTYPIPASGVLSGRHRDAILGTVASLITREGFLDLDMAGLLERLSFERLYAHGQVNMDDLRLFYRGPEMLLDDLFGTMLTHLEVRIAKIAIRDPESMGRFERAYRTVIAGRANMSPLMISGLDNAMVSRLFLLFMSVMDHESKNGVSFTLQQRWMNWYNKQIARYDEPSSKTAAA